VAQAKTKKNNKKSVVDPLLSVDRLVAFDNLLTQYVTGDHQFRNTRLKLIPCIIEGNWFVRKFVGTTPAILGKNVKVNHYDQTTERLKNVISIDIDVTSSVVASNILSIVKGYAKSLVIDLIFLLQGDKPDELCESLIGGVRMLNIDLDPVQNFQQNAIRNKKILGLI